MVKHISGTWWPDDQEVGWHCVRYAPCTMRGWAQVSWLSLKTKVIGFSGLGLKTGSYSLVICSSKSLQWFLGLDLKTKWATICRSCHKTNGRRMARDTCRDLAACFAWKQVGLGFPCFASKLTDERRRLVHMASSWRSRWSEAKRWLVRCHRVQRSGSQTNLPFLVVIFLLAHRGILVFWFLL
jgi:hypothetical protein